MYQRYDKNLVFAYCNNVELLLQFLYLPRLAIVTF